MKTNRILFLFSAMVLLAGCAKEETFAPATEGTTLTVNLSQTKTYMGDREGSGPYTHKIYWSNGDEIAVNGTSSDALTGIADNQGSATFSFASVLSTPYKVLYPASIYTDATHVTLPAIQTYKAGGFADGMFPMAGYSSDGSSITVEHLCAIVKVSVKRASADADTDDLLSVRFVGGADEQVSGLFSIDYANAELTATSTAAADQVVKLVKQVETSTSTAADFYLVVPAGTYASGFSIIVQDVKGHIMTKSKASSATFEAGKLYTTPEFEFVPTGTELGVEISSAAELVSFAQNYNAGNYGADLVATLTANIDFSDAGDLADFIATGGIGTDDDGNGNTNYFNGIFNGNGKTISNLVSTVPLFAFTGGAGVVKDFTIDNSCSFTFTHPNTDAANFGAVVGYHKGEISGVTVNADVALAEVADVAYLTSLGGLVGRATIGTVVNSVYAGNISTPAGFTTTKKLLIGGLVAYFSNAGSVSGTSAFQGSISNEAQVTSTDKTNPYLIIGGVAGYLGGGASVTANTTADNASATGADPYSSTTASIVNKTTVAYHSAVGGIVGELVNGTVSNCTNAATIFNTVFKVGGDGSRYIRTGGIVGINRADGVISGCINNGAITHRSNPRLQSVGGIAGYNVAGGSISSCTNNADIAISTAGTGSYSARIPYLGGVIGENYSTVVSDVHNTGDLEVSRIENTVSHFVCIGGVVGYNKAAIDGESASKNITNSGKVYESGGISKVSTEGGHNLGGVVGYTEASVQNVVNTGYVHYNFTGSALTSHVYLGGIVGRMGAAGTISGCSNNYTTGNEGEVYMQLNNYAHTDLHAGGILGYTTSDVTLSGNNNAGYIHGGNATKQNGTFTAFGGIVGYLSGASGISDCDNSGVVYNDTFNNSTAAATGPNNGGIAGYVVGASGSPITISNCDVTASALGPRRGFSGGVVGSAEYVSISSCTYSGSMGSSAYYHGGIAGIATNTTISGCTYSGTTIQSSQIQTGGGIVATLAAGSSITGCSSSATTINKNGTAITAYGAIAGTSVAGTSISNCHYVNGMQICSDTNFSDGGGNTADL